MLDDSRLNTPETTPHQIPTNSATAPATEVGLIRGLDIYKTTLNQISIHASGVSLIDAKGVSQLYNRAQPFRDLRYRVSVLRDDDAQPDAGIEAAFQAGASSVLKWRAGRALEDELFQSMPDPAVLSLLAKAEEFLGADLIDNQIKSLSGNTLNLTACKSAVTPPSRLVMAAAAKTKQNPWFKTVSRAEEIGRDIVGPHLAPCANETCATFPVEISGQQGSHDIRSTAQSHGA